MMLNANKTKFMLFSRYRNVYPRDLRICTPIGAQIEQVSHYKYLGIWIDDKLPFKTQIENLTKLRSMIVFYIEINPGSLLKIEGRLFSVKLAIQTLFMCMWQPLFIPFSNTFYHRGRF